MVLTSLLVVMLLGQSPASPASRAAEVLSLGPVLDTVERDGLAYVALERGGLAVIDLRPEPPRLLRRMEEDRRFVRLVLAGKSLLAVEQREEAHAFSLAKPEAPRPDSLARALSGTQEFAGVGPEPKDSQRVPSPPSPPAAPTGVAPPRRLFFPRAETGTETPRLRYGLLARPFLALGATTATGDSARAGGLLLDAGIAWHPEAWPLVVSLKLEPVGVGLGTGARHTPGAAHVDVAYTTDYLEVGLGGGVLFGQPECHPAFDRETGQLLPGVEQCESVSGGTVHQTLRLGPLDGLHFAWSSSILALGNQFVFGSGRGELQLPLTERLALFGAGGGSHSGWAFGELGVRTFLRGSGERGSTRLSAGLGYVSLSDGRSGTSLSGPALSIGMEWRS